MEYAPVVLELLQGEDVLVEVLLKFLVGVVDVKLLEPIHLEAKTHFLVNRSALSSASAQQNSFGPEQLLSSDLKVLEAEDVEDADGFEVFLPLDLLVSDCDWSSDVCSSDLKHWEYSAMATESRESTACIDERETPEGALRTSTRVYWRSIK